MSSQKVKPIQTRYAGCHFRSRLEARWATFFDHLGIEWQYEPQGFELSTGRRYLPDFLLTDCGTWIEVKGHDAAIDQELMEDAARELPDMPVKHERGPKMLILGPIPDTTTVRADLGWEGVEWVSTDGSEGAHWGERYGFGSYFKNDRPWHVGWSLRPPTVVPAIARTEALPRPVRDAYVAARSARFEHGERG